MAVSVMARLLSHLYANIPIEILTAAFRPAQFKQSLDKRIIDEVIASRILMDLNLIAGKRTRMELLAQWRVMVDEPEFSLITGSTYDATYYLIPPQNREYRNIASVECISSDYTFSNPVTTGVGGNAMNIGNTVSSLAGAALDSRTLYNYPMMPQATLEGQNLIRVYPNMYADGLILECKLEYDSEFTNMNQNVTYHMRNLVVNAVKTYVYNRLLIEIDSSEVVGGMNLGAFKEKVLSYEGEAAFYDELLMKVRGGSIMDPRQLTDVVAMML